MVTMILNPGTTTTTDKQQHGLFGCLSKLIRRRTSPLSFFHLPPSPSLEMTPVYPLVTDIFEHTLINIHHLDESLNFWKSHPHPSSSNDAAQIINVLQGIQKYLAIFLSKLYKEVDVFRSSLPELLEAVNCLFLDLQDSVGYINNIHHLICCPLSFEDLGSDYDNNAHLLHSNLKTLDTYLSLVINKYRKPNTIIQHWKRYTIGAIGISLFSLWVLRHTSVPHIIRDWVLHAKQSITNFSIYHVHEPLTTIRDQVFLKKQIKVDELKQIQSTSDHLQSDFAYFRERNQRLDNLSDQGMLERLKGGFENLFRYPVRDIFMEGLLVSMLNQTEMQKYEIEKEILELNRHIARWNEKKIAYGDLLTIFLSFGGVMILLWVTKFTVAERKAHIARVQIRLLIRKVEKEIIELDKCERLENEEFHYKHGFLLYTLDRLYKVLEWDAKSTMEWPCLEEEVFFLGRTDVTLMDKLTVISCMKNEYASYCFSRHTISSFNARTSR